jgi:hypothetical protein
MAQAEKSTSPLPVRAPAAERIAQRASPPALDDRRPGAVAQRHLLDAIDRSPRATSQRGHIAGWVGAATAQPATLAAAPAPLEAPAPAQLTPVGVVQRDKRVVAGVDVDTDGGYTNWEGWHINWRLGSKKDGFEQYHLTSQDRTQHYFFIIDGGELKDTKPPGKLKPKRGTVGGLSAAPSAVQTFVRTNIDQLLP